LEHIQRIGPFLPASMTLTQKKCGNPNCRCAKQGPKHETALLTWKEGNTTRTLHVPRELRAEVAAWCAEWRKLKSLLEKMGAAQKQFLKTQRTNIKKSSKRS
jgi:hypothetical protein